MVVRSLPLISGATIQPGAVGTPGSRAEATGDTMKRLRSLITTGIGWGVACCAGAAYMSLAVAQERTQLPLEEVVVTAQKRTEALADVPMSVTVLGGDMLERTQAVNFQDLVALVPGFSINSTTAGITRITLRGVNTGGVASTVGVYLDDVPFGSSSGLANAAILSGDFDTCDLARVEVLRGPQGTLYGASSLGGVMKYVTNPPNPAKLEAKGQLSVENVKDGDMGYAFTGMVNVPLSDTFAIRATGFYRFDDGYIDSIGNNPIPSLTDPNINVIDGTRVEDNINSVDVYGGRIAALFEPSDSFSVKLMALIQNVNSDAPNFVDADAVTLKPLHSNPVRSRYQSDYTDIQYQLYSATIDWNLGAASLQSVTSYSTFEEKFRNDFAANTTLAGAPLASVVTLLFGDAATRPLSVVLAQTTSTDKFTQELRLVSADSEAFEWLIGAYYTNEDSGIDPQELLAVEAGTDTLAADIPPLYHAAIPSKFEEYALFANATWHIAPRFDLSFGARASRNEQSASQLLEGPLIGGTIAYDNVDSSESPFTYSVSPRFEITDNVSVYARVATGYRPGGPNLLPPGAPPGTPTSYDSDSLTNYEVGLKADSADGRWSFDVATYYLDWEDVQLISVVNGIGINANGGTAVSKGVEFAASVRPTDGLTLALNGAYTDAYLTEDTDPAVGGMDGDPLSWVPEWSLGLDGEYDWPVMSSATAYVGANLGYVDNRPADFSNRAPDGSIREAESYTMINLRAGIDFGRWSIELYGRNLGDEEGISDIVGEGAILPNGAVGLSLIQPRTYGVTVGASF
jgi:iron complex outermembrane recepter protein